MGDHLGPGVNWQVDDGGKVTQEGFRIGYRTTGSGVFGEAKNED